MAAVHPPAGLFLPFGDFIFCCFAYRTPLTESGCILRPKRSALHPLPRIRGYSAAVQSDVFQGQGSALIETDPRAELVLPLDARLPVTLHRHSVKEACVLVIQRGILATTAECLLIFHCAERNEDKAVIQARFSLSSSFSAIPYGNTKAPLGGIFPPRGVMASESHPFTAPAAIPLTIWRCMTR